MRQTPPVSLAARFSTLLTFNAKDSMARRPSREGYRARLSRYRPRIEAIIYILALVGVLVVVHLWIQQGRGFDRGCIGFATSEAVEASFDCEAVVQSGAGTLFGISNTVLGLGFYLLVAALTAVAAIRRTADVGSLKLARAVLVTLGVLYSAWLVYYQATAVGGYCALCLISAGVVATIFVVHLVDARKPASRPTSENASAMKKPISLYAGLAALTVVLAGADVAYFASLPDTPSEVAVLPESPSGTPATPAAQADCTYNPDIAPVTDWRELVSFADPTKGNPEAPVTVITYFDPNCPHCRTLHPIMEQVVEDHHEDARFVFKPFPLWQHSVAQVHALYAAAQEGKFFEMMQRQFDLQRTEGLSLEVLSQVASDIGMNSAAMETRIDAGLYSNLIMRDRERAMEAGVRSMPAVLINGRFVDGFSRTRACLGTLIEQAAPNE